MLHTIPGTSVNIGYLVMGPLQNNVYIIDNGITTFVVDPSCNAEEIIEALDGKKLDAIVLTHRHHDHVGAAADLRKATGATVIASKKDAPIISGKEPIPHNTTAFQPCPVDTEVEGGSSLTLGSMVWQVFDTPGHTPGSMCLYMPCNSAGNGSSTSPLLISGDTLFSGSIGRTDFPGGSMEEMRNSLKQLANLPDNTFVLPGHGNFTTIGAERNRTFSLYI